MVFLGHAGSSERASHLLGAANSFSLYLPVTVYSRHVSWGEPVLSVQPLTRALLLCAANLSRNQRHTGLKGEALAPQSPARVIMKAQPSWTRSSLGASGCRQGKVRDQGSEQGKAMCVSRGWEGALRDQDLQDESTLGMLQS